MGKIFFSVLLYVIFLNVVYKSFIYFTSTKVEGSVIEIKTEMRKVYSRNSYTYIVVSAPVVQYRYKNQTNSITKTFWGDFNTLEEKDKVTLLIDEYSNEIKLNTFYHFWFTELNFMIGFLIVMVVSVVLGNVLPEKKEKIKEWK